MLYRFRNDRRILKEEVKSETMARDPVCGAILDEKTSKFKIKHERNILFL